MLSGAGYQTLNDVLDLEREEIEKIPGMTLGAERPAGGLPHRADDGRRQRRRRAPG